MRPPALGGALSLPWRYTGAGGRDLRLDWLRGYCLAAMFVNHFVLDASWLHGASGHETFYTSAAEGFYFLSGLVLGMVAVRRPLGVAVRSILRRAWTIYVVAVAMALFFTALALWTSLRLWYDVQDELPRAGYLLRETLVGYFTLHAGFHGSEVLVLYVVYMLIAPLVLLACAAGRGWLVLLVSALVYWASQRYPEAVALPVAVYFDPAAWQVFFFGGMLLGYYREPIGRIVGRLPGRRALAALLVLAGLALWYLHATHYTLYPWLPDALAAREQMRPLRLLTIAMVFAAIFVLTTWLWKPLNLVLGWLLIPLGQASLWSFTAHLVIIVVLYNLPIYDQTLPLLSGTLLHIAVILLVWASVMLRNQIRTFAGAAPAPERTLS